MKTPHEYNKKKLSGQDFINYLNTLGDNNIEISINDIINDMQTTTTNPETSEYCYFENISEELFDLYMHLIDAGFDKDCAIKLTKEYMKYIVIKEE